MREYAEYLNCFEPLGPDEQRVETPRYILCMGIGETWNTVQRQNFRVDEVDEVLTEVRGLVRARGRPSAQWEVGSTARPEGLVDLLLERGLVSHAHDAYATAVVLRSAPPPGPPGMTAGAVSSLEEFTEAVHVQHLAFETTADQIAEDEKHLERRWRDGTRVMHAVWLEGQIVSAGTCVPTDHGLHLHGGATHPEFRGRGAYRSLLAARWTEAVGRGTPTLLTQGGSRSLAILEQAGFERVGHVHMLVDRFGGA